MKPILLYSGGMDSWLIDKLLDEEHDLLHVRLGTKTELQERLRLPKGTITVDLSVLEQFEVKSGTHLLPLRNLFLVSIASLYSDKVILGSVGGSVHYDNGCRFAIDMTDILSRLLSEQHRKVTVSTPYSVFSKGQLLGLYLRKGGNPVKCWRESFSCYEPNEDGTPCMKCRACEAKIAAFRENGFDFGKENNVCTS